MQIQLQQKEIEAALLGFITQQGIDLCGKQVDIMFTAGRKASGLSAELTIEDAGFPDFGEELVEGDASVSAAILPIKPEPSCRTNVYPEAVTEAAASVVCDPEPVVTVEAVKTTSLFS